MANRTTRYQAAVLRNTELLLLRYELDGAARRDAAAMGRRTGWWMFPGGGREEGESEEECVVRELREETHLEVRVERLLYDAPTLTGPYRNRRCFLCSIVTGEPQPGHEPEASGTITEVRWVDLHQEATWPPGLRQDDVAYEQIDRVREGLSG